MHTPLAVHHLVGRFHSVQSMRHRITASSGHTWVATHQRKQLVEEALVSPSKEQLKCFLHLDLKLAVGVWCRPCATRSSILPIVVPISIMPLPLGGGCLRPAVAAITTPLPLYSMRPSAIGFSTPLPLGGGRCFIVTTLVRPSLCSDALGQVGLPLAWLGLAWLGKVPGPVD